MRSTLKRTLSRLDRSGMSWIRERPSDLSGTSVQSFFRAEDGGGQYIHRFGEGAFEILRQGMADGRNREDDGGERTDVIVLVYPLRCVV